MKMEKKNLRKGLFAVLTVFAAVCLLFAACKHDPEPTASEQTDFTALGTAIDAAEDLLGEVPVYDPNGNWEDGDEYVLQADWDIFNAAIETAKAVYNNTASTQTQVDDAVTALEAAQGVFQTKIISTPPEPADFTALGTAIDAAEDLLDEVPVYDPESNWEDGDEYVLQADWDIFNAAIETAKAVYNNSASTQTQVDDAVTALEAAQGVFQTKIKEYDSTTTAKEALESAITQANALYATVTVSSDDGAGLAAGIKYASAAAREDFADAISDAQDVYDDPNVSVSAINLALTALNEAIETFEDEIKTAAGGGEPTDLIHHWWLNGNGNDEVGGKNLTTSEYSAGFSETEPLWSRGVMKADPLGATLWGDHIAKVEFDSNLQLSELTATIWIKPDDLDYYYQKFDPPEYGSWNDAQSFLSLRSGNGDNCDLYELAYCNGRIGLARGGRLADTSSLNTLSYEVYPEDYNDRWTHLAVTFEAGKAVLYVNGQKVLDMNGNVSLWDMHSSYGGKTVAINTPVIDGIWIGGRSFYSQFYGLMSDVRLYDKVLSAGEIAAIMAESPVTYTSTVSGVNVSPPTATVVKGRTETFTVNVSGIHNAPTPRTVTWSIDGANGNETTDGTTINATGLNTAVLHVSDSESLASLTVRATSNTAGFTGVSDFAVITISDPPSFIPEVTHEPLTTGNDLAMGWDSYWGGDVRRGYGLFSWMDGEQVGGRYATEQAKKIKAYDPDSYFGLEFNGLGADWPDQVQINGNGDMVNFRDGFLTLSLTPSNGESIYIALAYLDTIADGKGKAYFPVAPIQVFLEDNPDSYFSTGYYIGYSLTLERGAYGNPQIVEFETDKINLEVWVPKQ